MDGTLNGDAREAYDTFAPAYDEFNHRYMYERWSGRLLACARAAGLRGGRLLDVGCGTGFSFMVPLAEGMTVTGCDISPGMLERARVKVAGQATLVEADMRVLPTLGEFDLIWSVSDALNYLADGDELRATLGGMRRNLAPGGLIVFDVNTLAGYRGVWVGEQSFEREGRRFRWIGAPREVSAGGIFESTLAGDAMVASTHRQRHFPEEEVRDAVAEAGLRCVAVYGESDGNLELGVDEAHHTKAVYVCEADSGLAEVGG
jgi:SAM-dependent methyltransferase